MDYPTSNSGARFTWYCLAGEGGSIHTSLLGPRSQKNVRCKNVNNIWTMMTRTKAEPESFTKNQEIINIRQKESWGSTPINIR